MPPPFPPIATFAPRIRAAFEKAGWYPGRDKPEFEYPNYPSAIQTVLREIGDLKVKYGEFIFFRPNKWPDYFEEYAALLGRQLYPIGITQDYWDVCVDVHGSVYIIGDWLRLVELTFEEGITDYLTGRVHLDGLNLNEDDMTWGPEHRVITWPALPPDSPDPA